MKVSELIEHLSEFDREDEVTIVDDDTADSFDIIDVESDTSPFVVIVVKVNE